MRTAASICLIALLGVFATGCGSGTDGLYEISGQVLYGGEPVPGGAVSFEPDTSQGNSGPGCNAPIEDGTYKSPPDRGVTGGPYNVTIYGTDGVSTEGAPMGTPIFEPYRTEVDLPEEDTTHDFEIPKQ